jgi:hypothetical protein
MTARVLVVDDDVVPALSSSTVGGGMTARVLVVDDVEAVTLSASTVEGAAA